MVASVVSYFSVFKLSAQFSQGFTHIETSQFIYCKSTDWLLCKQNINKTPYPLEIQKNNEKSSLPFK